MRIQKSLLAAAAIVAVLTAAPLAAQETPSPEGAKVYIVSPSNGAIVKSPVTVIFGLSGMGVAPAEVETPKTGHHHLLIDVPPFGTGPDGAEALTLSVPKDENHLHFGGGQTQATLDLPPGSHTLQLVLGDHGHVPHVPPVISDVVTITVE